MRHGFVKVAAATPDIRVADVEYNTEQICRAIDQAYEKGGEDRRISRIMRNRIYMRRSFYAERFAERGIRRSEKDCRAYKRQKHSGVCGNALTEGGKLYNTAAAVNDGK